MAEREGVTKYSLDFQQAPAPDAATTARLNAWRRLLYALALTGRDPERYDGLGFGNLSRRVPPWDVAAPERAFLVTGTQTGMIETLESRHYTTVMHCLPGENRLCARGPVAPSSEALTHGALYATHDGIRWIFHVHSPHIWQRAQRLGIAVTDPDVPYGTPEMAAEVARVQKLGGDPCRGILSMGGHEDGVLAWGETDEQAGSLLLCTLARAYEVEATDP